MQPFLLLYAFFCCLIAFILKGIAGFGDPLVSNPLLSVLLPNRTISPSLLPVSFFLNLRIVVRNRDRFDKHIVLPITFFVLTGTIPGTLLLKYGSPTVLKLLLGLLITGLGIEMLSRNAGEGDGHGAGNGVGNGAGKEAGSDSAKESIYENTNQSPKKKTQNRLLCALLSFTSGICAGLFGINLLFLAYLERVAKDRDTFRFCTCFVFLFENLFRLLLYAAGDFFTEKTLLLSAVMLPASLIGMQIGSLLDRKISNKASQKIIILLFIAGGISTLIHSAMQLHL